jgi:pilus assembly protein Flp/PilA
MARCRAATVLFEDELEGKEVTHMSIRTRIAAFIASFRRDERAQGLAEYALILALIAIVCIVALLFMGSQISDKLSVIGSTLNSVTP